jgi:hypothetical protein
MKSDDDSADTMPDDAGDAAGATTDGGDQIAVTAEPETMQQLENLQPGQSMDVTLSPNGTGGYTAVAKNGTPQGQPTPPQAQEPTPGSVRPGSLNDTTGTTIPSASPVVSNLLASRRARMA